MGSRRAGLQMKSYDFVCAWACTKHCLFFFEELTNFHQFIYDYVCTFGSKVSLLIRGGVCMASRGAAAHRASSAAGLEIARQETVQRRINESEARLKENQKASHDLLMSEMQNFRAEVNEKFKEVESEMQNFRAEVNEKFKEANESFKEANEKFEEKHNRLESKFDTFQMWMFGLVFAMLIGFMSIFFAIIFTR